MPSTPGKGKLNEKTVDELWEEYRFWNEKITNASDWGAALAAANEFRRDILAELHWRGEEIDIFGCIVMELC